MVAQLKLTATAQTPASKLLKPLVAAVKTGQLKSSIDGIPISFKVSDAGFRFLTSSGKFTYSLASVTFTELVKCINNS